MLEQSPIKTRILLFAAGINLILLQLFMIREFAITLFCTELIILLVTVAYFLGYSIGYVLSERIRAGWVKPWLVLIVLTHLPMIAGARYVSAFLREHQLSAVAMGIIVGFAALTLTSFYTVFLPRAISAEGSTARGLATCYSLELAGSACGLALTLFLSGWRMGSLAVVYQAVPVLIAWCLGYSRTYLTATGVLSLAVLVGMPKLDRASTEYFYDHFFNWIDEPTVLYSSHTPYQKIDVLDTADGRTLHLNGLEYFNPSDLEDFNFFLSEVPVRLAATASPPSVLIVGSGSMSSLKHLGPFAKHITTVEIDAVVAEVGKTYFADFNDIEAVREKWTLVIDDAKHFLSTTEERYDLTIIDVPAPWFVQTGLLFTQEFYELAKSKMTAGGMISLYLTETVQAGRRKRVSSQILAALVAVFDDLYVINSTSAPYGFAIAGDALAFDQEVITGVLREARPDLGGWGYDREHVMEIIGNTRPASYDNLDIVWDLNVYALPF